MTMNLSDEQITAPGRLLQVDLMRATHIEPLLPVRQMVKRLSQIQLGRSEMVPFGVAPHEANEGLEIVNDGETIAQFEVHWQGNVRSFNLEPGEVGTLPGLMEEMPSFEFHIQSIDDEVLTLGVTETYTYDFTLGDGIESADVHSLQVSRFGNILTESLSIYVQGRDDYCGTNLWKYRYWIGDGGGRKRIFDHLYDAGNHEY